MEKRIGGRKMIIEIECTNTGICRAVKVNIKDHTKDFEDLLSRIAYVVNDFNQKELSDA